MALKLLVTQIKSTIDRPARHKQTMRGLGLRKIGHTVELPDTPAIRGMIRQVSHLITIAPQRDA